MKLRKAISVKTFESLNRRMSFKAHDQFRFTNSQLGSSGEFNFGKYLLNQSFDYLAIYDSEFEASLCPQLDFIVVTWDMIYLYDIKNFSGNYYYEDGEFFTSQKKKIRSPFIQLDRAYETLDILLRNAGIQFPITKRLIFINPEFQLYGNSDALPLVTHAQLNRHFQSIKNRSRKLDQRHHAIADYIESRRYEKDFYDIGIFYSYDRLKKGVWCCDCVCQALVSSHRHFLCPACRRYYTKTEAVMHCLYEFRLLFPEKKITSVLLRDWCGHTVSLETTRKVLSRYSG